MAFSAKVLKDSLSQHGVRLSTLEVTIPRLVLAEFNTHRVFSRNSASSRAIPVEKRISMVESDPFIPESFGKNQKGMQASEDLDDASARLAREDWMSACKDAVTHARALAQKGVHKQLANRLIEPFCWQTIIVSSTEWDNWDALRMSPDAQPEIRKAAEMMFEARRTSVQRIMSEGEWHLPLVDDFVELVNEGYSLEQIKLICVGRCARVSYLTHDGIRDPQADVDLAIRLKTSGHMSPFEHAATQMSNDDAQSEIIWQLESSSGFVDVDPSRVFCGNFRGWKQFRKEIPFEDNFKMQGKSL